ncbi:unnamed protein product [Peronospora belbahrii]|uniref:Uncharacterized protein n=1 Tax=Peronospora belbahrii TaxID=622444 RepID=A0ABN8CPG6_9STRA|nr:unnamed protein product [Peronospora belbahrii]
MKQKRRLSTPPFGHHSVPISAILQDEDMAMLPVKCRPRFRHISKRSLVFVSSSFLRQSPSTIVSQSPTNLYDSTHKNGLLDLLELACYHFGVELLHFWVRTADTADVPLMP